MKNNKLCVFVMPIYIKEEEQYKLEFFKESMQSIFDQSCEDWAVVLVDDCSNNRLLDEYVEGVIKQKKQKIIFHKNETNMGAGSSRNVGIDIADEIGGDIIVFLDADDIAHPKRVEITRDIFMKEDVQVLYSTFIPIDENGDNIRIENCPFNIRNTLNYNKNPITGKDVWKILLTEQIYVNLTSSTSVCIEVAKNIRFPKKRTAEDSYTWTMYSAYGAKFYYTNDIPSKYRMPQNNKNNSLSTKGGEELMYTELMEALFEAFNDCSKLALEKNSITKEECIELEKEVRNNIKDLFEKAEMYNLIEKFFKED